MCRQTLLPLAQEPLVPRAHPWSPFPTPGHQEVRLVPRSVDSGPNGVCIFTVAGFTLPLTRTSVPSPKTPASPGITVVWVVSDLPQAPPRGQPCKAVRGCKGRSDAVETRRLGVGSRAEGRLGDPGGTGRSHSQQPVAHAHQALPSIRSLGRLVE